eukprot:CAMPEP_0180788706 /NCGR_PEP_ID=MMETSP1038_2-20121128/52170_1 /TAXON_ID=632150 /ORGANISM="Azadinium spinosum, Strain 3D9" /LENGTH=126 /DNA_ID=CAMNT_0022826299 /DNA_START=564 /DNA_END=941 /DNA_ORIENTATION=+
MTLAGLCEAPVLFCEDEEVDAMGGTVCELRKLALFFLLRFRGGIEEAHSVDDPNGQAIPDDIAVHSLHGGRLEALLLIEGAAACDEIASGALARPRDTHHDNRLAGLLAHGGLSTHVGVAVPSCPE